jgi:uncharacterized membrane protein YphA (DoxX/SURF4 family)
MSQPNSPEFDTKARSLLAISLMLIRIGIAVVFLMWTIDKFANPEHTAKVFEKFYKIPSLTSTLSYAIGGVQLALVLAFLIGAFRTWTYGLVLLMHAVSTFSSWANYLDPWTYPNLLFFAAIPMLSACIGLWLLREFDTYSIDGCRKPKLLQSAAS